MDDHKAAIEELTRARDLISDPTRWTQHTMSEHRGDHMAYCATGAMLMARKWHAASLASLLANDALDRAAMKILGDDCIFAARTPVALNDTTDHETVMLMFKTAITDLEQEDEDGPRDT